MTFVMEKYICMEKDLLDHGGWGTHLKNIFLFPISLIGEMIFSTQIYHVLLVVS